MKTKQDRSGSNDLLVKNDDMKIIQRRKRHWKEDDKNP